MLFAHITFAMVGIVGAYLRHFLTPRAGQWLAIAGLFGVTATGIALFAADPERFLGSAKFLANMAAMLILIGVEIAAAHLDETRKTRLHLVSALLWTWIFLVALLA